MRDIRQSYQKTSFGIQSIPHLELQGGFRCLSKLFLTNGISSQNFSLIPQPKFYFSFAAFPVPGNQLLLGKLPELPAQFSARMTFSMIQRLATIISIQNHCQKLTFGTNSAHK
jgi:hypothetical protein